MYIFIRLLFCTLLCLFGSGGPFVWNVVAGLMVDLHFVSLLLCESFFFFFFGGGGGGGWGNRSCS